MRHVRRLHYRVPVRSATIMGPKGWQDMRRSSDNYFIAKGGVFKCAFTSHGQRLFCFA